MMAENAPPKRSLLDALHLAECAYIAALHAVVQTNLGAVAKKEVESFVERTLDVLKLHDDMVA